MIEFRMYWHVLETHRFYEPSVCILHYHILNIVYIMRMHTRFLANAESLQVTRCRLLCVFDNDSEMPLLLCDDIFAPCASTAPTRVPTSITGAQTHRCATQATDAAAMVASLNKTLSFPTRFESYVSSIFRISQHQCWYVQHVRL